ncbi:MAG TPA: M36 family metallopeptidase [Gemmatimonadales bacterium]|nr:M36 family metallopeptidase [Gemmatimonadales bacterium]
MNRGRVYLWTPDPRRSLGGYVTASVASLPRLQCGASEARRLRGQFVVVRNGGAVNEPDPATGGVRACRLADAEPNAEGDFLFEPGRGGGRIDKVILAESAFRWRYVQAARFGEVNTYFHVDRMAAYVDGLLQELSARSLPRVIAVVTAHAAATEYEGRRDGVRRPSGRWFPFQGGHYRLPSRRYALAEHESISPEGEIHLGPGWMLLEHGALVEAAGGRYRANASHNAGIIYHEYGHHIARHTADFAANAQRRPTRQRNRKSALEEGTCDYWTATLLETPHIWAWHRRHDDQFPHRRCLVTAKTMRDYDPRPGADPHANGTIFAAALWDVRSQLAAREQARAMDLLLLQALLFLGCLRPLARDPTPADQESARSSFAAGLSALLHADDVLNGGRHHAIIQHCFAARGIRLDPAVQDALRGLTLGHAPRGTRLPPSQATPAWRNA